MKQVRLQTLELTNYRNIEHQVLNFDKSNAKIIGDNRIGKTNTLEAIYFLLTNYLLDGSSDLTALKPLSDTTKEVRVEGTFEVIQENNLTHTIRLAKTYGENWVKKKGTGEMVLQGHYEEYFVNGIKQSKERDFYDLLQEFLDIRNDEKGEVDTIQMLCNPLYLGNLGESKDWTKLRTFIVKLIGDVSDKEIFEKAPTTKIIEQDLTNSLGKTDQLKKMYSNDLDTLENQRIGFDSQIELLEKTEKPTDEEIERAKEIINGADIKIADIKSSIGKDSVAEQLEKEIFNLEKEIVDKNQVEFKEYLEKSKESESSKVNTQIRVVNDEINDKVLALGNLKVKYGNAEVKINNNDNERNELVVKYKELTNQIKDVDNQVVVECPTCHRPFDANEIEKKKQELLSSLENQRNSVVEKGQKLKEETANLRTDLKELKDQETALSNEITALREEYNKLNSKVVADKPTFHESEELVALRTKANKLKQDLALRREKVSVDESAYADTLNNLANDKANAQKVLDDMNYYERQMSVLENVKASRKEITNKIIDTEQKKEALKLYIYTKLRLLDEHIAKVFGNIKFQLIKENLNGGFDPICKPYIYDVDKQESTNVLWKNGSKSEKVITGIAIVEAIRKELDLTELPFLFDEGGEISNETLKTKFQTPAQIVCVRVEDNIMKPLVVKF